MRKKPLSEVSEKIVYDEEKKHHIAIYELYIFGIYICKFSKILEIQRSGYSSQANDEDKKNKDQALKQADIVFVDLKLMQDAELFLRACAPADDKNIEITIGNLAMWIAFKQKTIYDIAKENKLGAKSFFNLLKKRFYAANKES